MVTLFRVGRGRWEVSVVIKGNMRDLFGDRNILYLDLSQYHYPGCDIAL